MDKSEITVTLIIAGTLAFFTAMIFTFSEINNDRSVNRNIKMIETVRAACHTGNVFLDFDGKSMEIKTLGCR
jgi:hypothetical protein